MGTRMRLGLVRCGLVALLMATSLAVQPGVRADSSDVSLDAIQREVLTRVGVSLTLRAKANQTQGGSPQAFIRVYALLYAMGSCLSSGKRGVEYLLCIDPQQKALELSDADLNGAFALAGTWSFGESFTHTFGKITIGNPYRDLSNDVDVARVSHGELEAQNGGTASFDFYESGDGFDLQYTNSGGDKGHGWIGWVKGGCVLVGTFQSDKFGKGGIENNGVIILRRC